MTDRINAARALLAPRPDPELAGQVLAARAMLGDREARATFTYTPTARAIPALPGARAVYRCVCRKIISGPEARCKSCGHSNTRNASGRAQSIR